MSWWHCPTCDHPNDLTLTYCWVCGYEQEETERTMKPTITQSLPVFLRLNEVTLKSADGDDIEITPMIVSVTMIAQIYQREMARPKGQPVIVGVTKAPQKATVIKLTTGLGFHVQETPEEVYEMIQSALRGEIENLEVVQEKAA